MSKKSGTWGPNMRDPMMLGPYWVPLIFGNSHIRDDAGLLRVTPKGSMQLHRILYAMESYT